MTKRGGWGASIPPPLTTPAFSSGTGAMEGAGRGRKYSLWPGPGSPKDMKRQGHRKAESLGSGAAGLTSGGRANGGGARVKMTQALLA